MKNYIITNPTSKFGHDFVQRDENGTEIFRKEITSKTTDGYYHLPVVVNGRKLCKISHIGDAAEFCIDTLPEKSIKTTTSVKSAPKSKINLDEYYTKEERAKIEKLQAQIDEINEAVTKRAEQKLAEQALIDSAMGLTIEQLEAIMATKKAEVKA